MTQHYPLALIADKPHLTDRSIDFFAFFVSIYLCDFREISWQVALV